MSIAGAQKVSPRFYRDNEARQMFQRVTLSAKRPREAREVKPILQPRQTHVGDTGTMTYRLSKAETRSEVSPREKC